MQICPVCVLTCCLGQGPDCHQNLRGHQSTSAATSSRTKATSGRIHSYLSTIVIKECVVINCACARNSISLPGQKKTSQKTAIRLRKD